MAARIRALDWSRTPLGPLEDWPQSLRTSVSLILNSQHPMWIGWGPEMTFLYNDAYIRVLSLAKHPWALGRPASEVWAEIWDVCDPLARKVFEKGEPSFVDDVRLFMSRGNYLEEGYWSFSYSPIRDESGGVGGLFCPSAEVTANVLNTRRLRTLSGLSADAFVEKSVESACSSVARTLAKNLDDIPFALLYLLDSATGEMKLRARTAVSDGAWASDFPFLKTDFWTADKTDRQGTGLRSGQALVISIADVNGLPEGPAQQKVREAIVLPVGLRGEDRIIGVLIAAVNPTRKLDDDYCTFYELVASHVATAIANASAYQEERKRAQALAELDKAKTTFFSNVSHEFRTPLTLMLGPIESALERENLPREERHELELLHRNAMRLLKLVNVLLDFSRIEAGRTNASYEPVDLAALTTDVSSVFRSVAERAGLRLRLNCPALPEPVYVDRDMWEKIVLNLVSNAFKSTFEGEIAVSLHKSPGFAELVVSDTGTGIPAEEIPHLFERFRRVEGAKRRTNEGSGIGLALVNELVGMHGGSIAVESTEGVGSTFTVKIPMGSSHLPSAQIVPQSSSSVPRRSANAYVQEALGWLPDESGEAALISDLTVDAGSAPLLSSAREKLGTILLVDDNHDMREYVSRLLASRFHVETANNGRVALEMASHRPPDLVLTDVMMPEMDGFQLLSSLRSNPATSSLPVVMLSARAGEESRVEGLQAGADDYLVKPFTARELLARVESHIKMAHFRRQTAEHEAQLQQEVERARNQAAEAVEHISDGFWAYDSEWRITYMNPAAEAISQRPRAEQVGRTLWDLFPELVGTELEQQFCKAMAERCLVEFEWVNKSRQRWFRYRLYPTPDDGVAVYVKDSTESRLAEQALRRAEQLAAAGKLAASISHEINNPLEAITNLLFLAKSGPELSEQTKMFLQVADSELQRLSHIARTSLKFYRQSTLPSAVQVKDLLESVLMVHQARLTKLAIQVERDYRPAAALYCFPSELQQVFTNLISNALDALNREGTLSVTVRSGHGGLAWEQTGIRVTIADTGSGMDARIRARLFEPFFTTKLETGTGLGLWVSRSIVEKHGGSIHVVSAVGKGTAFSLFFPHRAELSQAA